MLFGQINETEEAKRQERKKRREIKHGTEMEKRLKSRPCAAGTTLSWGDVSECGMIGCGGNAKIDDEKRVNISSRTNR